MYSKSLNRTEKCNMDHAAMSMSLRLNSNFEIPVR